MEDFICETCGKAFSEDWRKDLEARKLPKRFCSRSCSNTRQHSVETKEKISRTLLIRSGNKLQNREAANQSRVCPICKGSKSIRAKMCSTCKRTRHSPVSAETRKKLSKRALERIQNGTHNGFRTRPMLSYGEQMVKNILDSLGYEGLYITNFPVRKKELGLANDACYFLDFYFEQFKLDLEIDGIQHTQPEYAEKDRIRDEALIRNGFEVIRIPWRGNRTKEQQKKLLSDIEAFCSVLAQRRSASFGS